MVQKHCMSVICICSLNKLYPWYNLEFMLIHILRTVYHNCEGAGYSGDMKLYLEIIQ